MSTKYPRLTECPKCGSPNIENVIPDEDSGQGAWWPMIWCKDCNKTSDGSISTGRQCYDKIRL